MGKYESLIGAAGILGLISFSSLIQKIYETRNTSSLPFTWILSNTVAQLLALIYGVANNSYGISVPSAVFMLGLIYIMYVKIVHKTVEIVPTKSNNASSTNLEKHK